MAKLAGFIGGSAISTSSEQDCEQTINYFLEVGAKNAKNQAALYPSPGFSPWVTVTPTDTRALHEMNGMTLSVIGNTTFTLAPTGLTGIATPVGTVANDSQLAQIVSNGAVGAQFLIAAGTNAYCYTPSSSTFTQVLTGEATMVGMLDGYGIALNPTTSKMRISNLNNFSIWNPTQFAQRGDAPDNWVAMVVNIPDVWLIGQQTGTVWFDAGAFPFPFAPRPGATFKSGIIAPWSLKSAAGYVIWLSRSESGAGVVVQAVGYAPQRVSTYELETAIAQYARTSQITDAEAVMFLFKGHLFYALTFPSAGRTHVLDVTTGIWLDWGKWISAQTAYTYWQPRCHCYANGQHLVGDRATGTLSLMDDIYGLEADGSVIRRVRITPAVFTEHRNIPHRRLEVMLEHGLGVQTGLGSDPVFDLWASDDGGKTYRPPRTMHAGKIGAYSTRTYLTRLGTPQNRVYKFVMTDPVPWRLIDAYINNDEPGQRGG